VAGNLQITIAYWIPDLPFASSGTTVRDILEDFKNMLQNNSDLYSKLQVL
jgi:hypothetical protein